MEKELQQLLSCFPHDTNIGQRMFFEQFAGFLQSRSEQKIFLLKGYAGTGKTTIISSLVNYFAKGKKKSVLMAPTGRAAKVMSSYSTKDAATIHRTIYNMEPTEGGRIRYVRSRNRFKRTCFIVDEASMIPVKAEYGRKSLLDDLLDYVFEGEGNFLVMVGDTAQLPPVGQSESLALVKEWVESKSKGEVHEYELTEVMRQQEKSGILTNATQLRESLLSEDLPVFTTKGFNDFYAMPLVKIEDGLNYSYDKYGRDNTIIICRSNRAANQYNQYIRRSLLYYESELEAADKLMVVKNNYAVAEEYEKLGFLANGDFLEVKRVLSIDEKNGFHFADVEAEIPDFPEIGVIEIKLLLDTLHSNAAALTKEDQEVFHERFEKDYNHLTPREMSKAVKEDKYLNAVQVKFAYAVTCHKSQGGQWDAVFIDHGNFDNDDPIETKRWMYTALTRAKRQCFLINFSEKLLN